MDGIKQLVEGIILLYNYLYKSKWVQKELISAAHMKGVGALCVHNSLLPARVLALIDVTLLRIEKEKMSLRALD